MTAVLINFCPLRPRSTNSVVAVKLKAGYLEASPCWLFCGFNYFILNASLISANEAFFHTRKLPPHKHVWSDQSFYKQKCRKFKKLSWECFLMVFSLNQNAASEGKTNFQQEFSFEDFVIRRSTRKHRKIKSNSMKAEEFKKLCKLWFQFKFDEINFPDASTCEMQLISFSFVVFFQSWMQNYSKASHEAIPCSQQLQK